MEFKRNWLSGVADVELMFPKYDKLNNYVVHSCFYKLPAFLKTVDFDAIIMTSTFMSIFVGNFTVGNDAWISQYEFLKKSTAEKIVFAQDDYWFTEVRDSFYIDYSINRVFLVCPPESWNELVPNYISKGGEVAQGYTTYVTPYIRGLSKYNIEWTDREYDIVYRGKKNPKVPNHIGEIKGQIGDSFLNNLSSDNRNKLKLDLGNSGVIIKGENWYKFLTNSRCILGSNSGSSVRLRNVEMMDKLLTYADQYPHLSYYKIEQEILGKDDRNRDYTAISPRNLESSALRTVQFLVCGSYSGMLEAHKEYFPLQEDCSNAEECINFLRDTSACKEMIDKSRIALLENPELDCFRYINKTTDFIRKNNTQLVTLNFSFISKKYSYRILPIKIIYFLKCSIVKYIIRLKENIAR
jgi:hypothetical protein